MIIKGLSLLLNNKVLANMFPYDHNTLPDEITRASNSTLEKRCFKSFHQISQTLKTPSVLMTLKLCLCMMNASLQPGNLLNLQHNSWRWELLSSVSSLIDGRMMDSLARAFPSRCEQGICLPDMRVNHMYRHEGARVCMHILKCVCVCECQTSTRGNYNSLSSCYQLPLWWVWRGDGVLWPSK